MWLAVSPANDATTGDVIFMAAYSSRSDSEYFDGRYAEVPFLFLFRP